MGEQELETLKRFAINSVLDPTFEVAALNVNKITGEIVIALKRTPRELRKVEPEAEKQPDEQPIPELEAKSDLSKLDK